MKINFQLSILDGFTNFQKLLFVTTYSAINLQAYSLGIIFMIQLCYLLIQKTLKGLVDLLLQQILGRLMMTVTKTSQIIPCKLSRITVNRKHFQKKYDVQTSCIWSINEIQFYQHFTIYITHCYMHDRLG